MTRKSMQYLPSPSGERSRPEANRSQHNNNPHHHCVYDDPKLLFHVRRMIEKIDGGEYDDITGTTGTTANAECHSRIHVDELVDRLRTEHREYRRRPSSEFVNQVRRALAVNDNDNDDDNVNDDDGEGGMDGGEHDEERAAARGVLNAGLRQNYVNKSSGGTTTKDTEEGPTGTNASTKKKRTKKHKKYRSKGSTTNVGGGSRGVMEDDDVEGDVNVDRPSPPRFVPVHPTESYDDLGGLDDVVRQIRELVEIPLVCPGLYGRLALGHPHLDPTPRGVLLRGPPGCGKTHLARAVAGEVGVPLFQVSAPELVAGVAGESERRVRTLFAAARAAAPSVIFLDEVDAVVPKRGNGNGGSSAMERRVVAQLLTCMDSLGRRNDATSAGTPSHHGNDTNNVQDFGADGNGPVVVIGATNRPDAIDPALRRAGRFDREIRLGMPDESRRRSILCKLLRCQDAVVDPAILSAEVLDELARRTSGYVGADLVGLVREASAAAVHRLFRTILPPDHPYANTRVSVSGAGGNEKELGGVGKDNASMETMTDAGVCGDDGGNESKMELEVVEGHGNGKVIDADTPSAPSSPTTTTTTVTTTATVAENPVTNETDPTHQTRHHRVGPPRRRLPPAELTDERVRSLRIVKADLWEALSRVQPSARREGFATVPADGPSWEDVGALADLKDELMEKVVGPIRRPQAYRRLGLPLPAGLLLFGPPGCGKTLVARALSRKAGAAFISVKGPELLDKYVGESERAVRSVFERARSSTPCLIFMDEMDALCPRRGGGSGSVGGRGGGGGSDGNGVQERVVNQLLTEMDGLEDRTGVFVLGATNRPELIDPAVLRPGRLDRVLYVPLPSPSDRSSILKALCRKAALADDAVAYLDTLGRSEHTQGYSGADLAALLREAGLSALREQRDRIAREDLEEARSRTRPSVSPSDRKRYEVLRDRLCGYGHGHGGTGEGRRKRAEKTIQANGDDENGDESLSSKPKTNGTSVARPRKRKSSSSGED